MKSTGEKRKEKRGFAEVILPKMRGGYQLLIAFDENLNNIVFINSKDKFSEAGKRPA